MGRRENEEEYGKRAREEMGLLCERFAYLEVGNEENRMHFFLLRGADGVARA